MLTKTEYKVLRAISHLKERDGVTPSIAEIADYLERSAPSVLDRIKAMVEKGYLKKSKHHRSIELLCNPDSMVVSAKFIRATEFPAALWDGDNPEGIYELLSDTLIDVEDGILIIENRHQVKVPVEARTWILKVDDGKMILIKQDDNDSLNEYEIIPI